MISKPVSASSRNDSVERVLVNRDDAALIHDGTGRVAEQIAHMFGGIDNRGVKLAGPKNFGKRSNPLHLVGSMPCRPTNSTVGPRITLA